MEAALGFAAAAEHITAVPSPASTPVPRRRPIPRAGVRQGLVNRIRGLLAWSSHPNPAGRGKVRLGQKASAIRVWPWPTDPCTGGRDGAVAADPRCRHAGGHSHRRVPACAAASGPPACRTLGTGASRWHGSAGRQRDEPIHRLGAAAVQQSSCFSVKSPTPCLEKKQARVEQVPGPVQGGCEGLALVFC